MRRNYLCYMLVVLSMTVFGILGCQKEQKLPEKVTEESQEENYFNLEEIKESGQNIDASFSFGVHNYDNDKSQIIYKGGVLQVDFEISPQNCSFDCSVMIYIDGILQEYALESQGEADEQHTVSVNNEKTIVSAFFIPQVDTGRKKHNIHFLCMYNPDYTPDSNNTSYGHAHSISQLMSWEFVLKGKAVGSTKKVVSGKTIAIAKKREKNMRVSL